MDQQYFCPCTVHHGRQSQSLGAPPEIRIPVGLFKPVELGLVEHEVEMLYKARLIFTVEEHEREQERRLQRDLNGGLVTDGSSARCKPRPLLGPKWMPELDDTDQPA